LSTPYNNGVGHASSKATKRLTAHISLACLGVVFFLNGAKVLWPLSIAMTIKADVEATLAKYMTNLNILQKISEG
jgi:hypothetical protein